MKKLYLLLSLVVTLLPLLSTPAYSGMFVVTSTADPGDGTCDSAGTGDGCTLREAITASNANVDDSTITFDATAFSAKQTIFLTGSVPSLSSNLSIIGPVAPGAGLTLQSNSGASATLTILSGTTRVANVTLSDSNTGVYNFGGTAIVTNCTIINNINGIWNYGLLTVTNSTLANNTSDGIFNIDRTGYAGDATVRSCTITGNSNGIWNGNVTTVTLSNSLVVSNTVNIRNNVGTFNDEGHNITTGTAAQAGLDPAGLEENGGPTQTIALVVGSPALDSGASDADTDQRGVPRPAGSADDIGAYEAQQYRISGFIRANDLTPIAGVSVQLSTTARAVGPPVLTDTNGFYAISRVIAGRYTLTPTLNGFTFSPASQTLVVRTANRAANFIGTRNAPTFSISGRISTATGQPLPGISVALSPTTGGLRNLVVTNSAGYYIFHNVPAGERTITPSLSGYRFSPSSRTITVNSTSISGQNFIGATGYTVNGRLQTSRGISIAGASVQLDGGPTVTTNSAGYYTFRNVTNGEHIITPSQSGMTFTPASKTITVNEADLSGQNFIGREQ